MQTSSRGRPFFVYGFSQTNNICLLMGGWWVSGQVAVHLEDQKKICIFPRLCSFERVDGLVSFQPNIVLRKTIRKNKMDDPLHK